MNIEVCSKKIFKQLLYFILFLFFMNIFGVISKVYLGHTKLLGLIRLFDFNTEGNIPSFFSALTLLSSSALLATITSFNKKHGDAYLYWAGLAVMFLLLSIDEFASIHEMIDTSIRYKFNLSGFLYYSWIIPYAFALILVTIVYYKFITRLPKNILFLFITSAVLYVTGALGFEAIGGWQATSSGTDNITYHLLYSFEELLEMLGSTTFIYALLKYISVHCKPLVIKLKVADQSN